MSYRKICFYLLFQIGVTLKIPHTLASQNLKFEQPYVERSELFHSRVNSICQDSQGFIWIASQIGLLRYDGYDFKSYLFNSADTASISGDVIFALAIDYDNMLWIGTENGLDKFNPATEVVTHYKHAPMDCTSISSNQIETIYVDHQNTIWLGTRDAGVNRFNRRTNNFTRFLHYPENPRSLSHNYVEAIFEDSYGNFWFGTGGGGLNLLPHNARNSNENNFLKFRHEPNVNSLSHDHVCTISQDSSGYLWIGTTGGGLNRLELIEQSPGNYDTHFICFLPDENPQSLNHPSVWSILIDRQQRIWLGTFGGGLNLFDPKHKKFRHFQSDFSVPNRISEDKILTLFQDQRGIIWIGTANQAINLIYPTQKNFTNHLIRIKEKNGRELEADIFPIYPKSNDIFWLGTFGNGLLDYNLKTNEVNSYRNNYGRAQQSPVFLLDKIRPDVLMVTTYGAGVYEFNENSKKFRASDFGSYHSIPLEGILYIIKDHFGGCWMTTFGNGLKYYNPVTGVNRHFVNEPQNPASLSNDMTSGIYYDRNGNIWIGTFGHGLDILDKKWIKDIDKNEKVEFRHYVHEPHDSSSIANNTVIMIHEDRNKNIWVGTYGGGICRYDSARDNFIRYMENDGIVDNHVCSILEDDNQNLWLGTHGGINKINTITGKITGYNASDGLQITDFNAGSCWRDDSGQLYFGGKKGLVSFHPREIQENPIAPPVKITGMWINDSPAKLDSSISAKKRIKLNYLQRTISIKFSALNFMNPGKNKYAYKMEGVDAEWIYCGTNRQTRYTNLTPGTYRFRVKASNNDGIWNNEGVSIKIVIAPPWWRTSWAFMLYSFSIMGLFWMGWRFQVNRIKMKNELERNRFEARKLEEIDRMKSNFFSNITHEFRTPLTLILGPLEQLLKDEVQGNIKSRYQIMHRAARRLHRLINQLLEISKIEAGQMALGVEYTDITRAVKNSVLAFGSLAERKGIKLEIKAEQAIWGMLDFDKTEKIVCNLLSNAFKFTQKGGAVEVKISSINLVENGDNGIRTGEYLQLVVKDTGKGISAEQLQRIFNRFYQVDDSTKREQEGTGIGLALVKELVGVYRGTIEVESQPGQGTQFCVQLPMDRACFPDNEIRNSELVMPQDSPYEHWDHIASSEVISFDSCRENGTGHSVHVLLVEDNPDMVAYIRDSISNTFQISSAENGLEGLAWARKNIPDIIVSDVMMPKMNGLELCAKIKTDERTSHIPVILLTARAAMEDKIEGLETGADDYLIKPFNIMELQVRMNNLIVQREKLREQFQRDFHRPLSGLGKNSIDREFLNRLDTVVQQNITNLQFDVEKMAEVIGMSRAQLHRKLRALTNQSPGTFLRMIRLRHAARLLESGAGNVAYVALEVGYSSLSHFAKSFQTYFGVLPSEFAKKR